MHRTTNQKDWQKPSRTSAHLHEAEDHSKLNISQEDLTWQSPLLHPFEGDGGGYAITPQDQGMVRASFTRIMTHLFKYIQQRGFNTKGFITGPLYVVENALQECHAHLGGMMQFTNLEMGLAQVRRIAVDLQEQPLSQDRLDELTGDLQSVAIGMLRDLMKQRDTNLFNYLMRAPTGDTTNLRPVTGVQPQVQHLQQQRQRQHPAPPRYPPKGPQQQQQIKEFYDTISRFPPPPH